MKIGGQRPDYYSDGQPQNRSGGLPHRAAAYDTGDAPCDSSAGVNFPDQDIRSFTCHNISQYTAPYTGKDADKNKEKSIVLRDDPGSSLNSYYSEDPQPRSITPEHDFVIIPAFDPGLEDLRVGVNYGGNLFGICTNRNSISIELKV